MKVGIGFDVHPFIKEKPLYLGGVRIPFSMGLKGHSDGDAVIHSIIDALLGASGKGDKGKYFPDTDPRYKGADSGKLLKKTIEIARARVVNVDCVVFCDRPKLTAHYGRMKKKLASLLEIPAGSVSIKATRTEGLSIGGGGIACFAACLIEK